MAKFVRLTLWRKITRMGGGTLMEIVEKTGRGRHSVKCALTRMRKDGCVVWSDGRWYTTSRPPVDGQGSSPASLANLVANRAHWKERLAKANAVRLALIASGELKITVPYSRRKRRSNAELIGGKGHILDRCFGLVSVPGKVERIAPLSQNSGKGRRGPLSVETPEDKEAA